MNKVKNVYSKFALFHKKCATSVTYMYSERVLVTVLTVHPFSEVLKDQNLRRIAQKSGHIIYDLGYELDLEYDDIKRLENKYSDPADQVFHVIMVGKYNIIDCLSPIPPMYSYRV